MSNHPPHTVERHCDVAVIGGSSAGLAAALQLGRQRRSVIVVDAGEPRNAPADHVHGYLTREGLPPDELLTIAREDARRYGAEVLTGRVERVSHTADGHFRLAMTGGNSVVARRVLAATGLVDELPDFDGLEPHWGDGVIHCPFCHGYEVRDRRVVQIITHPMGLHPATLFRHLTTKLCIVLHDGVDVDAAEIDALRAGGASVVSGTVRRIVTGDDGRIAAVELADHEPLEADVVVVGPRFHARADALRDLGIRTTPHASGLGDVLETDPTGATAVAGVYAAGNVADPSHQVLQAAADGSRVGAMISFDLAEDDLRAASRRSSNEHDWDVRYGGEPLWSGHPNASLVAEVSDLPPGRALDVGAGEGGDAIWLSEHGWTVTASDIAGRALDRIGAEAERRGRHIERLHADANALDPFPRAAFDLVAAHYASIPRTPDGRAVQNLLGAVAPGGTLLVVSHDLEPMRAPIDPRVESRAFDPDAYVQVDEFAAAIADSAEWDLAVNEKRPRPAPGTAVSHHVDDVVLRARRRPA